MAFEIERQHWSGIPDTLNPSHLEIPTACVPSFAPKGAGQLVKYCQEVTTVLIHYYHWTRKTHLDGSFKGSCSFGILALVRERTDEPNLFGR